MGLSLTLSFPWDGLGSDRLEPFSTFRQTSNVLWARRIRFPGPLVLWGRSRVPRREGGPGSEAETRWGRMRGRARVGQAEGGPGVQGLAHTPAERESLPR